MKHSSRHYSLFWHSPGVFTPISFLLALMSVWCFHGCSAEIVSEDAVMVCSDTARTLINIEIESGTKANYQDSWRFIKSFDVFSFDTEGIMHLDSYTHVEKPGYKAIEVFSGKGKRKIVMVANADMREIARQSIFTYEDMKSITANFTDDSADYPLMSGECLIDTGDSREYTIIMKPVLALLEVDSITSTIELKDLRIYLINAAQICRPFIDDSCVVMPTEFVNYGKLDETDLKRMKYPRMVYHYIGNGKRHNGISTYGGGSLYCYPNNTSQETAGSPYTSLIIEGEVNGITQSYKMNINQKGCGYSSGLHGIVRNTRYLMDIVIN